MFAKLNVSVILYLLAKCYVRFLYNCSVGCLSNETHFLWKYLCKLMQKKWASNFDIKSGTSKYWVLNDKNYVNGNGIK